MDAMWHENNCTFLYISVSPIHLPRVELYLERTLSWLHLSEVDFEILQSLDTYVADLREDHVQWT